MTGRTNVASAATRVAAGVVVVGVCWGGALQLPAAASVTGPSLLSGSSSLSGASVVPAVTPAPDPGGEVDPTPELTPHPSPTDAPVPTETASPEPEVTDEPEPSPEATEEGSTEVPVAPEPEDAEPGESVPHQRPASPPAVVTSNFSWASVAIAAIALLASGILLSILIRRGNRRQDIPATVPNSTVFASTAQINTVSSSPSADTLTLLVAAGEAMIDSGYTVSTVRDSLENIAAADGGSTAEIIVFPTALLVSVRDGDRVETRAASSGQSQLLLFQIEELDNAVNEARRGVVPPNESTRRIRAVRDLALPFGAGQRLAGYAVLSVGLAALLGASWGGLLLAGALGAFVAVLLLLGSRIGGQYRALVTVAAAFIVTVVVLVVVRMGLDPGVFPSLVAPLIILLPGALLTTAVTELSTGQIMAGSARLAAGAMQLVLLAFGIVAGGALVGVPSVALDIAEQPLGAAAPWIGVGLFGVGIVIYQCARLSSLGWILLVLYVAYGAQVLGDVLFGGVLSAFFGALVMTPVAVLVGRQPTGPPAMVSFLPAFWLLVPGALGLVGVTTILDGDASGVGTLVTTAATMVAISLGVLVGLIVSSWFAPGRRLLQPQF